MNQGNSAGQGATCPELDALIDQCDSDDPDPGLVEQAEQHMETCAVCARAESDLEQMVTAYRSTAVIDVSIEFERSLVERLCRKPNQGTPS